MSKASVMKTAAGTKSIFKKKTSSSGKGFALDLGRTGPDDEDDQFERAS